MKIIIEKSKPRGKVGAPPSKSFSHRALICAALCSGKSVVNNISTCDDVLKTAECLNNLGAEIEFLDGCAVVNGVTANNVMKNAVLDCGESGSTFRFLLALSAMLGSDAELKGSERLFQRVYASAEEFLEGNGCSFICGENSIKTQGAFPIKNITLNCADSSQLLSGVLMALPLTDYTVTVNDAISSAPYIDITDDTIKNFGVCIISEDELFSAKGAYKACDYAIEGDWSSAAFLYALAALGDVSVNGLNEKSLQGDKVCKQIINGIINGEINTVDVGNTPDLFPVLAAVAVLNGGCAFTGTKRLHNKESDRVAAITEEFAKFGVTVLEYGDAVTVGGGAEIPREELFSHNDHRVAMALTVLCAALGGTINGIECTAKSLPEYFGILDCLNINYRRC